VDKNIHEDLAPIIIDLGSLNSSEVNELNYMQTLAIAAPDMLGYWVKGILGQMFGGPSIPVTVRGTPSQIKTFANTLQKERRYIESYHKYGLDNANTYKSKAQLQNAVGKFERATGIKWPFK
jgi:hypothetical protein